jgi:methylisocitrate lyase
MDKSCVVLPGAFNALCARAIAKAGFEGCYVSGAATSVSAGVPDVGVLTLDHFARTIREIADAARDDQGQRLPVLADADTGFGEEEMIRRTVIEYARAGAAGLHLEDQVFPKRCGHLDGKELVSCEQMCSKIQWASRARSASEGFLICARTDARGVSGMDDAVRRARAYVEAGADMIFPEGLTSEAEFAQFAHAMRSVKVAGRSAAHQGPYLLANMTEFGKTPMLPVSRFAAMGYSCVIFPVSLLRIAMGAVTRALDQLKKDGTVEPLLPRMQTRQDLYALIGYKPGEAWEFPG